MKIFFWFFFSFIVYTYLGYPVVLFIWAWLFPKEVGKKYIEPSVSVVITAYNEKKNIGSRLDNLLAQDYPQDKLEIIVVSDGSTDGTNDVITQFCNHSKVTKSNISLITYPLRKGKPFALNIGLRKAKGEIIVFADVRQHFEKKAIKNLVANFHDQKVGCVSGELVFHNNCDSIIKSGILAYWNYEKWIRKKENKISSMCGATGAIYAIRSNLYRPITNDILLDDVLIPLNIVFERYRAIFDSDAIAYDIISKNMVQEKSRKIRTLVGNWQLISRHGGLLNPFKNPIFFQYLSHKVFRLLIPFFFIGLFMSALFLKGIFYRSLLMVLVLGMTLPFFEKYITRFFYLKKSLELIKAFSCFNYFAFLSFFYFIMRKKNLWVRKD